MTRNVWSTDDKGRRRSRGRYLGAAVIVATAGVAAWYLWWPAARVDCETLVGRSQAALEQADRDLKAAAAKGTAAKCAAYRERVTVLTQTASLPAVCGPPPKRAGAWPSPTDERKWYETLIFEECR